jgi:hypothetical protein
MTALSGGPASPPEINGRTGRGASEDPRGDRGTEMPDELSPTRIRRRLLQFAAPADRVLDL